MFICFVPHFLRAFAFVFCLRLATFFTTCAFRSCMVHVKFIARPGTSIVSPKFSSMALDDAPEVSVEQREISAEQPEDSLVD
jgi:hypothetical protein